MRIKNILASLLIFFIFYALFCSISVKAAFADTFLITGTVTDSSSTAIQGATVSVNDPNSDTTTTDINGSYNLSVPSGIYNVQVTPQSGEGLSSLIDFSQNISANITLNFILTPSGTVTIQGHIYSPAGNGVPNQLVSLSSTGNTVTATTDTNGSYTITVAPGTYTFTIRNKVINDPSYNVPQVYTLTKSNYSATENINNYDIILPLKKVSFHVQDPNNNSLGNVSLTAGINNGCNTVNTNLSYANITGAIASSCYGINTQGTYITTDVTTGNANLWLFPTSTGITYNFSAIPPTESGYLTTPLNNISVTADMPETITMQTPVTISGHIYSPAGNGVPNQQVSLASTGIAQTAVTDSNGAYTISATPGTYTFTIKNRVINDPSYNVPQVYTLMKNNYLVSQNLTNYDITLPLKKVSFHVQDPTNVSLGGVGLKAAIANGCNTSNTNLSFAGITGAIGSSCYGINTQGTYVTTDSTTGNANLWLFPTSTGTTYSFTAIPPSGSTYLTVSLNNISVTNDMPETITMQQQVTLQGHIYSSAGNAIPNVQISLSSSGNTISTITDSSGYYTINVTTGIYTLRVSNSSGDFSGPNYNVSQIYSLTKANYSVTQSLTNLDMTLPFDKLSFHVLDLNNNPVGNVSITAGINNGCNTSSSNLSVGSINGMTGSSCDGLDTQGSYITTDTLNGSADLWLFPTDLGTTYGFSAIPLSESIYVTTPLNNIAVTGNATEIISLQYNHATPITTATLSTPFSDGLYPDSTTVTLSATAAAGYTIANTYYTVDGGTEQTYTSPFTVTGAGNHTVTYWSVDNSGEPEVANTKTFTITEAYNLTGAVYNDANQNGFQDTGEQGVSGVTVSLNTGQTTTTDSNGNYIFSNLESGTYTETVTVPNGYTATTSNPVSVPLAADTTENFGIAQQQASPVVAINAGGDTQGNYAVDTDYSGGTTYSSSSTVDTSEVSNPAPEAVYQTIRYGNTFSYTIPNLTANGTYTARLHFNELYWNAAGQRIFNVTINGSQVLSNFDIYQTAGGKNKAIVEQFPATADSNGNITISFSTVTDNAMINGIEVYSGTLPSPTPTPTPTPVNSLAISAGGAGAGSYVADTDYIGGTTYNTSASIDTSNVTNPAPESIYQNVRYGNFSYTIATYNPNANYMVRLDFAEPYWNAAGQREFNVSINGTQVLNNFDVYQEAGGANKAVAETFNTTSDNNGLIKIQFNSVVDNAMVSGIQISQQ